jgi:hypothetical protein
MPVNSCMSFSNLVCSLLNLQLRLCDKKLGAAFRVGCSTLAPPGPLKILLSTRIERLVSK